MIFPVRGLVNLTVAFTWLAVSGTFSALMISASSEMFRAQQLTESWCGTTVLLHSEPFRDPTSLIDVRENIVDSLWVSQIELTSIKYQLLTYRIRSQIQCFPEF